jgi:hypothetical protein
MVWLEVVAAKPIAATVGVITASVCWTIGSVEALSVRHSVFDN